MTRFNIFKRAFSVAATLAVVSAGLVVMTSNPANAATTFDPKTQIVIHYDSHPGELFIAKLVGNGGSEWIDAKHLTPSQWASIKAKVNANGGVQRQYVEFQRKSGTSPIWVVHPCGSGAAFHLDHSSYVNDFGSPTPNSVSKTLSASSCY